MDRLTIHYGKMGDDPNQSSVYWKYGYSAFPDHDRSRSPVPMWEITPCGKGITHETHRQTTR